MPATQADAQLVVQLAQLAAMLKLNESTAAIFADSFDPATATSENPHVRVVGNYMETVATLVKNGLLDRELTLDWIWVAGVWERVAPAIRRDRERFGEPRLGENFEALASS